MGKIYEMKEKAAGLAVALIAFSLFSDICRANTSSMAEGRFRWSAVYRNLIQLEKEDSLFAWNDLVSDSHLMDIITFSVRSQNTDPVNIFLKGETGWGEDGQTGYSNRFYLSQGHADVSLLKGALELKAFLRERVFSSGTLLFQMVSSDSPYLGKNGEGLIAEAEFLNDFVIGYTAARLSSFQLPYSNGGLPWIKGQTESFNHIRAGFYPDGAGHGSIYIVETRRSNGLENVTMGLSGGAKIGGLHLIAEFAEIAGSSMGGLNTGDFEGIDPHEISWGDFSPALPSNSAFAAELHGIETEGDETGRFEFIPGYSYAGSEFYNPHGGICQGMIESYLLSVWRHTSLEAMIRLKAGDIYYYSGQKRYLYLKGSSRVRLKRGVGLECGILSRERRDPSVFLTIEDDNEFSGLRASFRLDGFSGISRFSFFTDGWVNIFEDWNLRSTLYLRESFDSRYSLSLEYRPSERFVFTASAGSFDPNRNQIILNEDWTPVEMDRNRQILISIRVWLGSIRN